MTQANKNDLLSIGERLGVVFSGKPTTEQALSAISDKIRDIHVAIIRLYPDPTMLGGHPADCKRRIDTLLAAGASATPKRRRP